MKKRRNMNEQSAKDEIEAVEITRTMNKKKQEDLRKFNIMEINEEFTSGNYVKIVERKPRIVQKKSIYVKRKAAGEPTHNRNGIVKVIEEVLWCTM